jgi:hypothetical protein
MTQNELRDLAAMILQSTKLPEPVGAIVIVLDTSKNPCEAGYVVSSWMLGYAAKLCRKIAKSIERGNTKQIAKS